MSRDEYPSAEERRLKRDKKFNSFKKNIVPKLESKYRVTELTDSFIIETEKYGVLIYYPKADSLKFDDRRPRWIKKAIWWIRKNL